MSRTESYRRLSITPGIVLFCDPSFGPKRYLVILTMGALGFLPYSLSCVLEYLRYDNAVSRMDSGTCG